MQHPRGVRWKKSMSDLEEVYDRFFFYTNERRISRKVEVIPCQERCSALQHRGCHLCHGVICVTVSFVSRCHLCHGVICVMDLLSN